MKLFEKFKKKLNESEKIVKVIFINGAIHDNVKMSSEKSSFRQLLDDFNEVLEEKPEGLILRINSPGGAAASCEELALLVKTIRNNNTYVVSSVGDMACSGAYLIASQSNYIMANNMSLLGSIGVIMQIPNVTKLKDKFGLDMITIKSGKMKDIGSIFRDMTTDEEEYITNIVEGSHKEFIKMVTMERQIGNKDLMFDGRFVDTQTALKNNLIDQVGTYNDAIDLMTSKLRTENIIIDEVVHKKSLLSRILSLKSEMSTLLDLSVNLK